MTEKDFEELILNLQKAQSLYNQNDSLFPIEPVKLLDIVLDYKNVKDFLESSKEPQKSIGIRK